MAPTSVKRVAFALPPNRATKCLKKTSSNTKRGARTNPVQMNLSLGNFDAAMPPAIAPKAAATTVAAALRKVMDASVGGSRRFGCWLPTARLTSEPNRPPEGRRAAPPKGVVVQREVSRHVRRASQLRAGLADSLQPPEVAFANAYSLATWLEQFDRVARRIIQ